MELHGAIYTLDRTHTNRADESSEPSRQKVGGIILNCY